MARPPGIEPGSEASETPILSIELRAHGTAILMQPLILAFFRIIYLPGAGYAVLG